MTAIYTKVEGGLGNQLFIYAASRALALRTGLELKFDLYNGFEVSKVGDRYLLDRFNVVGTVASRQELAPYDRDSRSFYWRKKLNRRLPFAWRSIVEERRDFEPRLLGFHPRGDVYLMGYWQRERYFQDHAANLRRELTPRTAHSAENQVLADEIRGCDSVFLHIRRGRDFRHLVSAAYYAEALNLIRERVPGARVFVFGSNVRGKADVDDITWARESLPLPPEARFVTHNGESACEEDLWLMSQCRHAILANSTFSWWGAWLNGSADRVVVAPRDWGYLARPATGWITLATEGALLSAPGFVSPGE